MSGQAFQLVDLPDYQYTLGQLACPDCYKPVSRNRTDGRCDECLHNKAFLPVNFKRRPKKKDEEEEEDIY